MAWSHGGSKYILPQTTGQGGLIIKQPSCRSQAQVRLSSISGNAQLCSTFTSKQQTSCPLREDSRSRPPAPYRRFCIWPNAFQPLWSVWAEPASTKDASQAGDVLGFWFFQPRQSDSSESIERTLTREDFFKTRTLNPLPGTSPSAGSTVALTSCQTIVSKWSCQPNKMRLKDIPTVVTVSIKVLDCPL